MDTVPINLKVTGAGQHILAAILGPQWHETGTDIGNAGAQIEAFLHMIGTAYHAHPSETEELIFQLAQYAGDAAITNGSTSSEIKPLQIGAVFGRRYIVDTAELIQVNAWLEMAARGDLCINPVDGTVLHALDCGLMFEIVYLRPSVARLTGREVGDQLELSVDQAVQPVVQYVA